MDYAKMPKMMVAGFGGLPIDEPFLTTAENRKNYETAVQDWNYGPEMPTNEPGANKPFYVALAKAMQCDEKDARRKQPDCGHQSHCTGRDLHFPGAGRPSLGVWQLHFHHCKRSHVTDHPCKRPRDHLKE